MVMDAIVYLQFHNRYSKSGIKVLEDISEYLQLDTTDCKTVRMDIM